MSHQHPEHEKGKAMAVLNESVCSSFHASPGDQINFSTPTTTTCNLTADGTWPFTDGPPLVVPSTGKTTYMQSGLPNSVYYYNVDCCTDLSRKSVTVP